MKSLLSVSFSDFLKRLEVRPEAQKGAQLSQNKKQCKVIK